jgi:hypothetical protein
VDEINGFREYRGDKRKSDEKMRVSRVARFFVTKYQNGKNIPNYHKLDQMSIISKKNRKMDRVSIKYTNIFS